MGTARDLEPAERRLAEGELPGVERLPRGEAVGRARDGLIADGKSVCALRRAAERLGVG